MRIELDEMEKTFAFLENAVDGESGRLLLTEIGIWVDNIPEFPVVSYEVTPPGNWDDPDTVLDLSLFKLDEHGPRLRMLDGPPRNNCEVPRELVLQNIRRILECLHIRVYVHRDRIEMKGFISAGSIEISYGFDDKSEDSIIHSLGSP